MPRPVSLAPVASAAASAGPAPAHTAAPSGFLAVLNALNPLQYVPVVGTIYRAITGDTIPEGLRIVGSLAVGAALSGPIGLVTSIAAIMAEKATGIDPDKIAHRVAVGLGLATDPPAAAQVAATADPPAPVTATLAGLSDAERLNAQELARIQVASAAYAKAAALG